MVLEKTLESPLACKEIKPVHPKGNQSWIFIGGTDAEAETPILWPRDMQNWLTGKDPDTGRDWRQEEKGMTEDEMVGWYHWLDRHWVWVGSRSWWWTGRPGVLQSMGWQRVGHDWVTELNWTEISFQVWNSPYSLNFAWDPGWGDKFESLTSCLHASWLHNKVLFFLKSQCRSIGFCACQAANSWCLTVFINLVWSLFHNVYPLKL